MLHPDYRDIVSALSGRKADFLLIGAYAMAAYGLVRATGDFDIWIRPTPRNADNVWQALNDFGAPLFDLTVEDLATPGIVFQIGRAPVRVDLLTRISGVDDFEEAWRRRQSIALDGLILDVLGREDLIRNKRATGRPKDLHDVAWLEAQGTG